MLFVSIILFEALKGSVAGRAWLFGVGCGYQRSALERDFQDDALRDIPFNLVHDKGPAVLSGYASIWCFIMRKEKPKITPPFVVKFMIQK